MRTSYFDEAKAGQAVRFFRSLRHTKGKWAGVPFNLQPWQEAGLREIYGRMNADGTRQYRTAYIEIARKNGKTEIAAGHALKLLTADAEAGAEVYGAAYTREQAGIVYRVAAGMTRRHPALSAKLKVIDSTKRLIFGDSFYVALPHEAAASQGYNPHGSVVDEYHVWRKADLRDALRMGMGTRAQPLEFIITTAGNDFSSPCHELHEYAERVIRADIDDPTFYAEIYSAPMDADWTDEDVWRRCNPALGAFRSIEEMRKECARAQRIPSEESAFRQYYLNQWLQSADRWISSDEWEANGRASVTVDALSGRGFYGFLDLSATSDLSAWVMLFPRPDDPEHVDIVARFWCPEARLSDDRNPYCAQYQAWARDGYLTTTRGNAIDYGFVRRQVIEDSTRFRLQRMNIDRLFQGAQLGMELAEELGADRVFAMGMGFISFAAPMAEFERRLLTRKLNHMGNPVLRWMAGNVVVKRDPAGNLKPDKAASQGKIDGIVGIVGALDAQMRGAEPEVIWQAV